VIDDGSSDGSLGVCEGFRERGVEVSGRENRGAHATINELIDRAATDCELIAILNSDDRYVPERFARCLPEFGGGDPSAAVVVSGLRQIDESGEPLAADHPRGRWLRAVWSRWGEADLDLAEWMGQANFAVTTSNVIGRREFFAAHRFKPYRFNHDYYFLSQAALRGLLRVVGEPLIEYRVHGTNTINSDPAPLIRELLMGCGVGFTGLCGGRAAMCPRCRPGCCRCCSRNWRRASHRTRCGRWSPG
jgi:glycosyltransferase involved in cell wall biosynthesis